MGISPFADWARLENVRAFAAAFQMAKPGGAKGTYVRRVSVSATMGPGVHVDPATVH